VGGRQRFVKTAQRELAKMRPGVHYGMTALLHTWHWCSEGLRKLGREDEALSVGLGGREAIETALTDKPEEADRIQAMKYLKQLGTRLFSEGRPEAEECLQRVLALAEGLAPEELSPETRVTMKINVLCTLAQLYKDRNDLCAGLHCAQQAVEVRRDVSGVLC
jgi:hypothetical protein